MHLPRQFIFTLCLVFGFCTALDAQSRRSGVSFTGERATSIQNRTVPLERSSLGNQQNNMTDQRFAIEQWQKQFSPMGQRRSSLGTQESRLGNQRYNYEMVEMPEKVYGMARFNERMANLRDDAQIDSDDRAWRFERAPRTVMDLQNMTRFTDLAEEMDLRDINRFQFRRNRADGVPVEQAGQRTN